MEKETENDTEGAEKNWKRRARRKESLKEAMSMKRKEEVERK